MAADARDLGDTIGSAAGRLAREATQSLATRARSRKDGGGPLSGKGGVAAGAVLSLAAPLVAKGAGKIAKEAGKKMMAGGGGAGGGGKQGTPGVGKGRRMPVQQAADVGVPLSVAYNQWTQFTEWPQFMHRLMQATQEDECTVSFKTKVWGFSREFVAQIVEQRPDERIQWNVTQGITHTGVVTFHELGPRLTRILVTLDVEPGSLLEKFARGMRHVKRAVRADLARFKAFIEMQEIETGAWRGVIHDGEVVESHPAAYDRGRDYAELDDIYDRESSHKPREVQETHAANASASRGSSRSRSRAGQHDGRGGTRQSGGRSSGSRSSRSSSSGRQRNSRS